MTNRRKPKSVTPLEARKRFPGLRQVDLASKAGVSLMTVVRCEKSERWPVHLSTRRAYLVALGLKEDDVQVLS